MAKTKKTKLKKVKEQNIQFKLVIFGILALILGMGLSTLNVKKTEKSEVLEENLSFYNEETCRCLERERFRCADDSWQLDEVRRLCVKGNDITNIILVCSKYECSGEIYEFDADKGDWEKSSGGIN